MKRFKVLVEEIEDTPPDSPEKGVTCEVRGARPPATRKLFEQTVDILDVTAVVKATNGLSGGDDNVRIGRARI